MTVYRVEMELYDIDEEKFMDIIREINRTLDMLLVKRWMSFDSDSDDTEIKELAEKFSFSGRNVSACKTLDVFV